MFKSLLTLTVLGSIFIRITKIVYGDIVYALVLLPILTVSLLVFVGRTHISFKVHKIDFVVISLFFLLLTTLMIATIRGGFEPQIIFALYVVVPCIIYSFVRIIRYDLGSFCRLMFAFTLLYSAYEMIEFVLYYLYPPTRSFSANYLQFSVGTTNFNPPLVNYPIFGQATKPWGPMLDASGSGAFLTVLFAFIYDAKQYVGKRYGQFVIYLTIFAVFCSGSKSAYVMLFAFIIIRFTYLDHTRKTYSNAITKLLLLVVLLIVIFYFVSFFFVDDLLYYYMQVMFVEPLEGVFIGLWENGIYALIGSGQENGHYEIVGMGEIDLFNNIFRYGLVFMTIFIGLLVYLIRQTKNDAVQFASLFFMFILSMNHYQVILKFPASMIVFMAIAVLVNNEKQKHRQQDYVRPVNAF